MIDSIGFILAGMTSLRYFMPLVIEAKSRKINSIFFIGKCTRKYNSVRLQNNLEIILALAKKYGITLAEYSELPKYKGIVFQTEGDGWDGDKLSNQKIFSLTYMTDYAMSGSYQKYIDKVDYVIFPSKSLAANYNCIDENKNLYLGSPKYDVDLGSRKELCKKYQLDTKEKYVLYAYPKLRDLSQVNTEVITTELRNKGYKILCKSRIKDRVPKKEEKYFDKIFYDMSWYPHTTMELLNISEFLINFESTTSKESILLKKPIIDFKVKPAVNILGERISTLKFLYDYDFYFNIEKKDISKNSVIAAIEYVSDEKNKEKISKAFKECCENDLFVTSGTSERILNFCLSCVQS
jgi:hypothetical protein